jgi:hypothetical protein
MSGLLLARTSPSDLQPLSAAGTAVRDHFPQLRALLAARFGAAYERLLAEPSFDGPTSPVDWYGPEGRVAEKLMLLPAQRRWEIAQRARTLLSEVRAESNRLRAGDDPAARVLGDQLDKVLRIPSLDYVYVIDDRPVIVAWAHSALGRSSDIVELLGLIEGGPPPPPPPAVISRATLRSSYLLLAALAVLFALATYGVLRFADQTGWFGERANILADTEAATRDAIAKIRLRLAEKCRSTGGQAAGATPLPPPRPPTNAAPSPQSLPKLTDATQSPAPDHKAPDKTPVAPTGAEKAAEPPIPPTDPDKAPKPADSTQPPAPDAKVADRAPAPSAADKSTPAPDAPSPPIDANKPQTPPSDATPSQSAPPKAADSTQPPTPDAKIADQTPAPSGAAKTTPETPSPPADGAKLAIPATPGKPLDDQKLTNRDPTIFKGCWSRTSQMQIEDVQKNITFPVKTWQTCMDEKGDGEQTIVFANGGSCKGRVHAQFLSDGLVEITDVEPCKGVNGPDKTVYTCARADERSLKCSWEQPASGRKGADVALRPE